MKPLLEVLEKYNPRVMSNGQIRMECPFRENHTDGSGRQSFFLSPDINAYHCFSCEAKGSLIKLLTTRMGVGYFDAVEYVRLTDYTPKKKDFELDIYWNLELPETFLKRGFKREVLEHFRLGTTDDGYSVIPFYDSFVTPRKLLGYQKRKDGVRRFVSNSSFFDKKHYLYNLDTSFDYVILVEGYSDVFRLYQHGYNACATLGTSLSDEQAEMLYGFKKVYLARDNDLPGRIAIEKDYHKLHKHVEILLIPYTQKDPAECISPKVWKKAFDNATDYFTYSYQMTMEWDGYLEMREKLKLK
jgi:DNA primase